MAAYYNEHDRFAAAWLRELIKAGLIAPGDVDERSIEDVQAYELKGYTQAHFFAGIGVWSYALRNAGWADDSSVWTGSCPCQSFSASGKRAGFGDKRHLWPAWFRLISECRPVTIFGEQVASADGLAWFDVVSADLEGTGYAVGAADTCAAGFGAPHIRQRLYFVAHAELRPGGNYGGVAESQRARLSGGNQRGLGTLRGEMAQQADGANPANESGDRGENASGVAESEHEQPDSGLVGAGKTRGFWADAEWLPCRDGKWRPVEPAPLGMADGLAAELGRVRLPSGRDVFFPLIQKGKARVGRLSGYGNALCAEQAIAFIQAAQEALGDAQC